MWKYPLELANNKVRSQLSQQGEKSPQGEKSKGPGGYTLRGGGLTADVTREPSEPVRSAGTCLRSFDVAYAVSYIR